MPVGLGAGAGGGGGMLILGGVAGGEGGAAVLVGMSFIVLVVVLVVRSVQCSVTPSPMSLCPDRICGEVRLAKAVNNVPCLNLLGLLGSSSPYAPILRTPSKLAAFLPLPPSSSVLLRPRIFVS